LGRRSFYRQIAIGPLSAGTTAEFIDALVGNDVSMESLRNRLVANPGGNCRLMAAINGTSEGTRVSTCETHSVAPPAPNSGTACSSWRERRWIAGYRVCAKEPTNPTPFSGRSSRAGSPLAQDPVAMPG
jgi:hypothetical protein